MRAASCLLLVLLAPPVVAQPPRALSRAAEASLLTMLPGEEVHSLFGHSALRVRDPASGLDRAYNYGTFDFNQPFFVARFAGGQLDYLLDTAATALEVERYRWAGRPVIEQRLALDAATVRALYRLLEANALPPNRTYRYDFFFDNCSTRLLDMIDRSLAASGRPPVVLAPPDERPTFRQHIRPYIAAEPLLWLGMDVGLGLPADRVATAREATFLPLELKLQLDGATVGGRPLVAATDTLFWVPGAGMPRRAFPWPLALGWASFVLGLAVTFIRHQRGGDTRWGRRGDAALFGAVGLAGVMLALLWFATAHRVTGPNLNLLWAWPTHLVAASFIGRDRGGPGLRAYLLAAGALAGLTALGWFALPQELPAPLLPLALLVALRSFVRASAVQAAPSEAEAVVPTRRPPSPVL